MSLKDIAHEPFTHVILERCEEDVEYKEEILDFLVKMEKAIAEIRSRLGE